MALGHRNAGLLELLHRFVAAQIRPGHGRAVVPQELGHGRHADAAGANDVRAFDAFGKCHTGRV